MKEDKKLINSFINSDEEILEEKKNNQQKSIIDMKDYA